MSKADVRFPRQQLDELNRLVEAGYYNNRSEAIREGVRLLVRHHPEARAQPINPRVRDGGGADGE